MIALAGGSEIFLGVVILLAFGVIVAIYTRGGSGIDQHPYRHVYGGAPGASHDSEVSGSDPVAQREQLRPRRFRRGRRPR